MQEDVLWLQISVNEAHKMEVFERRSHFACVEPRVVFWYTFAGPCLKCWLGQLWLSKLQRLLTSEELSTTAVLHAKI